MTTDSVGRTGWPKVSIRLVGLALAVLGLSVLVRRLFRLRRPHVTLTTQGGEPITEEALLTDVGESIAPERDGPD